MAMTDAGVHFDMHDRATLWSPYATYRRLRDEAPLYYNEEHDFYAVSRFEDATRVLSDSETFVSSKGMTFSIVRSGMEMPEGLFICEDDPIHAMHRSLVSRLFTPRAVNRLEPRIRALCKDVFDQVAGRDQFDFMKDVAVKIPVQVIGMLIGLPAKDQAELHAVVHRQLNAVDEPFDNETRAMGPFFNEYLDWREKHPTDDVMTQLLNIDFEDATGTRRHLQRNEMITFLSLITAAGSDTTATALGWAAKVLADHPDQRHELADNPTLIANAADEVLRCEPPSYHVARVLSRDVELHGQTVPAGAMLVVLPGAANRDDREFDDADTFNIHRTIGTILTFSFGTHFCLGSSLARMELRIGMESLLARFRDWTVDYEHAEMTAANDTRGWEHLPVAV